MKTAMPSKRRNMTGPTRENLSFVGLIEGGEIPEWMLLEVLIRLPSKVLFKFKIVSKQWCSIISGPSFAPMYVDRISRLPHSQHWILISGFANKDVTKHFFQKSLPLVLHGCSLGINCLDLLILPPVDRLDYIIVGVSNGLLLYGPRVEAARRLQIIYYDICNPITGECITLPPSEYCFEFAATGFVTQVEDNVLRSYRVVRVDVHHANSGFIRFGVYFSEIRKWMHFPINITIYFYKWKNPVVLGKILHWLITRHKVMAYDPYNKPDSVRLIPLPSVGGVRYQQVKINLDDVLFDEHQGHLRYFEVILDGQPNELSTNLSIWVLNDYDSEKWCMQHRVSIDDISKFSVLPLSFHPFDSDIVYMVTDEALLSYDFKTRKLKIVEDSRKSYHDQLPYCLSYFSFVIPPWPVSIIPSSFEVTED